MWSFCIFCRVTLDVLSVQATKVAWENKTDKAFWRGRDSRQERLDLVMMSRKEPEIIDAALTHMFFFKKEPEKYGELVKSTPFFDFFNVSLLDHIQTWNMFNGTRIRCFLFSIWMMVLHVLFIVHCGLWQRFNVNENCCNMCMTSAY